MGKSIYIMVVILGLCRLTPSAEAQKPSAEAQKASSVLHACGNAIMYDADAVPYCVDLKEMYQVWAVAKAYKKANRGCLSTTVMVIMSAGIKSKEEAIAVSKAVDSGQCLENAIKEIHRSKTGNAEGVEGGESAEATT